MFILIMEIIMNKNETCRLRKMPTEIQDLIFSFLYPNCRGMLKQIEEIMAHANIEELTKYKYLMTSSSTLSYLDIQCVMSYYPICKILYKPNKKYVVGEWEKHDFERMRKLVNDFSVIPYSDYFDRKIVYILLTLCGFEMKNGKFNAKRDEKIYRKIWEYSHTNLHLRPKAYNNFINIIKKTYG